MDAAEGEAMVAAVKRAGLPNMVWCNYPRVPAITLARQLIEGGSAARTILQDWTIAPDVPQGGGRSAAARPVARADTDPRDRHCARGGE